MFLVLGLSAVIIARDYAMGSAGRMGPGYFPTALGWLLAGIGAVCMGRSFFTDGEALEKFAFKELFLVLLSVLLFAALVRGAGLAVAIPVVIMISAYASKKFGWVASIALAVGATVFCILLFVKALGLPMPIIGPWFGA
jgi:hypothetical protein